MKKNNLFLVLIISLIACKKDCKVPNCTSTETFKQTIKGVWEINKSVGGIAGTINYPAGNGSTIEYFGVDSVMYQYQVSINPIVNGTYALQSTNTVGDYNITTTLVYPSGTYTLKDSIRLFNNQLVFLGVPSVDQPTIFYNKIR